MSDRFVKMAGTFFYIGYLPMAPGTMASLATLLLCFFLRQNLWLYILVFIAVTAIGFLVSGRMEKVAGQKDPSCIVIDEVSGMMIALFLLPWTPMVLWTAFFLFRAFDMFKIYPVNRIEKFDGAYGVMLDDVFAGLYTNLTMHLALRLSGAF